MKIKQVTIRYDIRIEWEGEYYTLPFDVTLQASRVTFVSLCEPEFYPASFRRAWQRGMPELEQRILNHHHAAQLREWADFLESDK